MKSSARTTKFLVYAGIAAFTGLLLSNRVATSGQQASWSAAAAQDPGVQSANRGTGATLIDPANDPNGFTAFFQDGLNRFQEVETVSGSANNGLGPRFNANQCSSCHAQPAIGGSSPAVNPQFKFVEAGIAPEDSVPDFITANGPIREVRFPFYLSSNGTAETNNPSGEVEDLFTVTGRADAGSCRLSQPNYDAAQAANDLVFRIPIPLFGDGLIENLDDSTLMKNQVENLNNNFGIAGAFNRNGNDGTISRFGWKAQNKSLHLFAGEAYNVEMGISNEVFPQDRPLPEEELEGTGLPSTCMNLSGQGYPEDTSNPTVTSNAAVLDDVSAFANFMRFLAPPSTGGVVLNGRPVPARSISNGSSLFNSIGCATCHNPRPGTTQESNFVPALSNVSVQVFSDIEIHHMGTGLADNISQGTAGGDQFRTAPLWGLGQRIFLLHDGRTTDLVAAIRAHASQGSEATTVVNNFLNLSPWQQQDLLNFLRSL
jgi:CxxC motif-containing protein (DUF1111 family)